MPYTSRSHCFHIHKAKKDITLLFLNDSANFNNGVKSRSDILNERLSPKPNFLHCRDYVLHTTKSSW